MGESRQGERADRGQAVVGVALWIGCAALVVVGLSHVAAAAADSARARTAADAAALAGAAAGVDAAGAAAARNDAELLDVLRDGDEVQVHVRVGRAEARARAERFVLEPSG